ncbi:MAG: hypothetical protein ACE145_05950 [Terriglobia bacterium]
MSPLDKTASFLSASAVDRAWTPDATDLQVRCGPDGKFDAHVVFTSHAATGAALRWVARLGNRLDAHPIVLMFYVVPYTLSLNWRAVPEGFLERRIGALKAATPVEFSVRIYLCRNSKESLRQVLRPGSLVVVGGKERWWPTDEQRLVGWLRKEGHQVFLVDSF